MKFALSACLLLLLQSTFAQHNPVGIFDNHIDIGTPKNSGTAIYDPAAQDYRLTGAGYNIWFERDELQYALSLIHI